MRLLGLFILVGTATALGQDIKNLCAAPAPDWRAPAPPPEPSAANLLEQIYAADPTAAKYPALVVSLERDAAKGNAEAQFNTGIAYLRGIGVHKDSAKALDWFQAAAAQGHIRAAAQLAALYVIGSDVRRDDVAGLTWTFIARSLGAASYNDETLETLLTKDQVAQAERKAVEWYRAHTANPAIAYVLASHYYEGTGIEKDDKEAFRWYLDAARKGYAEAQLQAGAKYLYGRGVPKNESEALIWFRRGAERGVARSQAMLALQCKKVDIDSAFAWLRIAADTEDSFSMDQLADWDLSSEYPKRQNLPEALHFAQEAVRVTHGANASFLHTLASAYYANGKISEALDSARQAVNLQPEDPDLLNALAWWEVTLEPRYRNPPEGLSLARRAVSLTKEKNPWLLDTLAEALFVNGAIDDAIATERKALALKPSNPAGLQQNLEKYSHARDKH